MKRLYESLLERHLTDYRQMAFLAGPRQVGKTTLSQAMSRLTDQFVHLNWDVEDDQALILQGVEAIVAAHQLQTVGERKAIVVLDELHKLKKWRNYLKGFFDIYEDHIRFIVTGSSKLDIYRHAGDSLMGRYFPYRVHPLSVAELLHADLHPTEIREPQALAAEDFSALLQFGGFPEPFSQQSEDFYRRWVKLRREQLFEFDIRDLTQIRDIAQMKFLATMLENQVGELTNYNHLSKLARITHNTTTVWLEALMSFYFCFKIHPWTRNIVRSLIKQPKIYLWDWASVEDPRARYENLVAAHLHKAIHYWEDRGLGDYGLYFIRDKEQREVDFLVTKNQEPWFLVEVKSSAKQSVSEHLHNFQKQTGAQHAFQVVFDLPYRDVDCFSYRKPVIVPAQTFLSQLV